MVASPCGCGSCGSGNGKCIEIMTKRFWFFSFIGSDGRLDNQFTEASTQTEAIEKFETAFPDVDEVLEVKCVGDFENEFKFREFLINQMGRDIGVGGRA
jgi:hypothetical protein